MIASTNYGPDDPPRWRQDGDVPPPPRLIHSPDNLEARYNRKRGMAWIGDQVHVTATCEDDTPHVITHVEPTLATTPDDKMLDTIHAALTEHILLPQEPLVDRGYTDAEILVGSAQTHGVTNVGPVSADASWQAQEATGIANSAFTIAWETHTATCP